MTESNVNADVIKQTQESLGKFVKKPPLTEKLLKKPPFKFIHDIVKVVIRDTNFLSELYNEDELNADNIKDREAKMKFLQKLIDVVKTVTGRDLSVKTSKIVAGLEADKTNELLQAIGYAIENKLDSLDAVNLVNKNKPAPPTKQKESRATVPVKSELKEKVVPIKQKVLSNNKVPIKGEPKKVVPQRPTEKKNATKENSKPVKEKERSNSKTRTIEQKDNKTKQLKKMPSKEKEVFGENVEKLNGDSFNGSQDTQSSLQTFQRQESEEKVEIEPLIMNGNNVDHSNDDKKPIEDSELIINGDANHHREPEQEVHVKPQDELAAIIDEEAEMRRKEKQSKKFSAKHRQKTVEDVSQEKSSSENGESMQQKQNSREQVEKTDRFQSSYKRESVDRPRTSLRPPSARPASSRPAAPRRRDKNVEIVLLPEETIKLGEVSVKMENFTKELEDDGENLVIIEDPMLASDNFINERLGMNNLENENVDNDEAGHLVQQILETQKDFSGVLGMVDGKAETKKTEIVRQQIDYEYDEGVTSQNQTTVKQIEHLKDLIQKLIRSVNPMGKLMDFIQEDVDSMQREYTKWNDIFKTATVDLKREQNETANAIEPLKYQLTQLESNINEHHIMIDQMRGSQLQNEQKIMKLFTEI
ncbi:unnamed protein product [Diamesa serratosioi]